MNKLIFLLCLIFYSNVTSGQKINAGINIMHIYNNGDGRDYSIFGSDLQNVNKIVGKVSKYKYGPFIRTKLVNKRTLAYFTSFLIDHCNNSNNNLMGDFFAIAIYTKDNKTLCYLRDKDASLKFFREVKTWMEKYPEKKQAKIIISEIDQYCR